MKIRFLSDLHLECGNVPTTLPSVGEDVVVLAGDIDNGTDGMRWAQRAISDRPVLYVIGNHEAYGKNLDLLRDGFRPVGRFRRRDRIMVLDDRSVVLGGVRFVGVTLWTDFNLHGEDLQTESMQFARLFMNDYRRITVDCHLGSRLLNPSDTLRYHLRSRKYLKQVIARSPQPVVVISHHGPFVGASAERYRHDDLSPAFNSDLTAMMREPVKAWIFGHTHHCVETRIGDTLVVSNQRGYPREHTGAFSWDRCIEVFPDHAKAAQPC